MISVITFLLAGSITTSPFGADAHIRPNASTLNPSATPSMPGGGKPLPSMLPNVYPKVALFKTIVAEPSVPSGSNGNPVHDGQPSTLSETNSIFPSLEKARPFGRCNAFWCSIIVIVVVVGVLQMTSYEERTGQSQHCTGMFSNATPRRTSLWEDCWDCLIARLTKSGLKVRHSAMPRDAQGICINITAVINETFPPTTLYTPLQPAPLFTEASSK